MVMAACYILAFIRGLGVAKCTPNLLRTKQPRPSAYSLWNVASEFCRDCMGNDWIVWNFARFDVLIAHAPAIAEIFRRLRVAKGSRSANSSPHACLQGGGCKPDVVFLHGPEVKPGTSAVNAKRRHRFTGLTFRRNVAVTASAAVK